MKFFSAILIVLISSRMSAQNMPEVDIQKFEGPWYVIGFKPTFMDKNWINTIESYSWDAAENRYDVVTTYKKSPDGKQKKITQKLLPVANSGNAKWIARIWFFIRADYYIYKVAEDYSWVFVGHPQQKYCYIMSRKPEMDEQLYNDLVSFAVGLGYKSADIVKQLQQPENMR